MKRLVALLLTLVLVFTLAACQSSKTIENTTNPSVSNNSGTTTDPKPAKDTMKVAISVDPGSLNPYDRLENVGRQLWAPVYESLFAYGEGDLAPVPVLVDTYKFSEDQKVLTITLKKGVKFHNDAEMTAKDVLFTFEVIKNSSNKAKMGDIAWDNIKALDDYTVEIPYNSVQGLALYYLCNLYILPEAYMTSVPKEQWATKAIGTGPYKWGDFVEGSEYNLLRFDGYREPKKLEKIVVRIIPDSNVQKIELETGGIDLACGLQHGDVAKFANDANDGFAVMPSNTIAMLKLVHVFPDGQGPLADVRVREAINYALNLDAINKVVFSGLGSPAKAVYPSGIKAYTPANNLRSYDVNKAKALLAEAGFQNGLTIDFYTQNTTMYQLLTDVVVGMLADTGIKLNVIASDFGTQTGYMLSKKNPGIYAFRQYANGDPYILVDHFFSDDSQYSQNMGHRADEKFSDVQALRKEAFGIIDQDKRNEVYHKLMQIIYDRQYFTPLIEYADQIAYSESVKGFWMSGPIYHYEDAYFE